MPYVLNTVTNAEHLVSKEHWEYLKSQDPGKYVLKMPHNLPMPKEPVVAEPPRMFNSAEEIEAYLNGTDKKAKRKSKEG